MPLSNNRHMTLGIPELRKQRDLGLITGNAYVMLGCKALQVDIATVDRLWLSQQLGMTRKATQGTIDRLRAKGLI
jgi:hypothetical protein